MVRHHSKSRSMTRSSKIRKYEKAYMTCLDKAKKCSLGHKKSKSRSRAKPKSRSRKRTSSSYQLFVKSELKKSQYKSMEPTQRIVEAAKAWRQKNGMSPLKRSKKSRKSRRSRRSRKSRRHSRKISSYQLFVKSELKKSKYKSMEPTERIVEAAKVWSQRK